MTDSPFIPGARVAVGERYGDSVTEGFVDKVHKNGNFTLRGSSQQWRAWKSSLSGPPRWSALETAKGYGRRRLDIWDAETDKEIREKVDASNARARWRDLLAKIEKIRDPSMALCEAVEAALRLPQGECS